MGANISRGVPTTVGARHARDIPNRGHGPFLQCMAVDPWERTTRATSLIAAMGRSYNAWRLTRRSALCARNNLQNSISAPPGKIGKMRSLTCYWNNSNFL